MWETLFDKAIGQIVRTGTLIIHLPSGRTGRYGDGTGTPITLRITDPDRVRRILLNPDLGVGEGYMDGSLTIDGDDLHGFLALAIHNVASGNRTWLMVKLEQIRRLGRWVTQYNPISRARENVAHHYDLSDDLYELFLDDDKQYSCAYFARPDMTLDEAQAAKKAHIAAKLRIEPGMRVLDIGCGWGGMALTLARDHGARVLGVTLSERQYAVATRRAKEAGLEDRVEFRLTDYRNVTDRFDRIVSVGMFEHVGLPHYREYFGHIRDKLKEDGVALVHTIGRSSPPGVTSPWILKYIFPGGYVPAMSEVTPAIEKEDLWYTDVEVWRLHYAMTLHHWYDRFIENLDTARALYDERFCRMWKYYLVACEQTFRHHHQLVFQFQLTRRQDAVPLTRDYLYRGDRAIQRPDRPDLKHAAE